MSRAGVVLLLLVGACATDRAAAPVKTTVHPDFAALRPVMVGVRAEGPAEPAADLRRALYDGLIERSYSALALGAPLGSEAGVLRATIPTEGPPWSATVVFEDPHGTVLYRAEGPATAALLRDLPRK